MIEKNLISLIPLLPYSLIPLKRKEMQTRTFVRKILDLFFDNAIVKTIASFVNFCNEQRYYNQKELKFLKKMPLNNNVVKNEYYKNRFIFNSITSNRTGSK